MSDLSVTIGRIRLKHPIIAAPGGDLTGHAADSGHSVSEMPVLVQDWRNYSPAPPAQHS